MKKTIVLGFIFLASVLVGCGKYASLAQAKFACHEWKMKGERLTYFIEDIESSFNSPQYVKTYALNRRCDLENATNQYLGIQGEFTEK